MRKSVLVSPYNYKATYLFNCTYPSITQTIHFDTFAVHSHWRTSNPIIVVSVVTVLLVHTEVETLQLQDLLLVACLSWRCFPTIRRQCGGALQFLMRSHTSLFTHQQNMSVWSPLPHLEIGQPLLLPLVIVWHVFALLIGICRCTQVFDSL